MNALVRWTVSILLFAWGGFPAIAGYSSFYIFGDGACTTTNGPTSGPYYGRRYTNGRVWVEVLAEWQGLGYDSNKNWSFYGHYSGTMLTNLNSFTAPPDAATALFVVWACDADMVWNVSNYGTNITQWTNSINQSLTNHFKIITNLYYGKNVRTLVMPNAVDLTKAPHYMTLAPAYKGFIRQQTTNFNARFAATLSNATATLPDLTIFAPDIFTLVDNVVAFPTNYGLIKPNTYAIIDLPPSQWALNGPGTNYVFWDDLDPTAIFHMWIADAVQRVVSPVRIAGITSLDSSNQLDLVNVPIGRNGFIEGSADFADWTNVQSVNTNFAAQSVVLPLSGAQQFYRLQFPFSWTWP